MLLMSDRVLDIIKEDSLTFHYKFEKTKIRYLNGSALHPNNYSKSKLGAD